MYSSIIPYAAFTKNTPAIPEFYWDVYSAEQRIKNICCELHKLKSYAEYLSGIIDGIEENVDKELESATSEIRQEMKDLHDEVLRLIGELEEGMAQWDVQIGKYQASPEAQRDMFNDVTVHSYNLQQFDAVIDEKNITVDSLANCGLNVKGLALVNHWLRDPNGLTSDLVINGDVTVNSYTVENLSSSFKDLNGYVYTEGN